MNAINRMMELWWRPLLFLAWIWMVTGLLANRAYLVFLRPEFGYVLGVGVAVMAGCLGAGFLSGQPTRFGARQGMVMLILLMPLAHLVNARGVSLGADAYRHRAVGLPGLEARNDPVAAIPKKENHDTASRMAAVPESVYVDRDEESLAMVTGSASPVRQPEGFISQPSGLTASSTRIPSRIDPLRDPDLPLLDDPDMVVGENSQTTVSSASSMSQETSQAVVALPPSVPAPTPTSVNKVAEITILDLYDNPERYKGKTVILVGMLHRDDAQVWAEFGRDMPVLFRFVINCCAADATPAAILLDGGDDAAFKESSWIRAEGVFVLRKHKSREVPFLTKIRITQTKAPAEPYLY